MTETQTPLDEALLRQIKDMERKLADISNSAVSGQFVTGDLIPSYAATRAGAVLCDGTSYLDTDPIIGTALAAVLRAIPALVVDATHVKVPDYRGYVIGGVGGSLPTLATPVGAASVTLSSAESGMPTHTHTATTGTESATHTHTDTDASILTASGASTWDIANAGGGRPSRLIQPVTGTESATHTHAVTVANATGVAAASAHTNLQPTLPSRVFIKT